MEQGDVVVVVVVVITPFHLVPGAREFILCLLLPFGVNDTEGRIELPTLILRNFRERLS